MELVKDILSVIVYTLITGCGVIVVKKLLDFGNAKIDELQETTKLAKYEKLNKLIDEAQSVIYSIVTSINQTFVDDLKASGEFNKESAESAKNQALEKAHELLTDEVTSAIEQIHGNVDAYLDILIEQIVNDLKKSK